MESASVVTSGSYDKAQALTMTVVKRNGMLVPFRRERIQSAIESAMRDTHHLDITQPLPANLYKQLQQVTDAVTNEVKQRVHKGEALSVEGVQDIVEVKLMDAGLHDVARDYILFREERKKLREDSPQNIKVLKRDGKKFVRFNPMKIASAIEKTFRATREIDGQTPEGIVQAINLLTNKIVGRVVELNKYGTTLQIELIQDEVEKTLMSEGYYNEAKSFILYRAERAKLRSNEDVATEEAVTTVDLGDAGVEFTVAELDGKTAKITERDLRLKIEFAAKGLANVNTREVLTDAIKNFYQGIRRDEIDTALQMSSRAKVEKDPDYTYLTARILIDQIYREAFGMEAKNPKVKEAHCQYFKKYIEFGISVSRLSPELKKFNLDKLAEALDLERDKHFNYLGIQTVYDRYLIHHEDRRIETPQIFWMRVAMGLALNEGEQKNEKAIEFYNMLSQFLYTSSTPTLFNSGTNHSQMSSCYLSTTMDDLSHIFKVVADDAQLSKWAGGLGNDWTNVRATGARIKGTNGRSQGVVPFLKVANDTAVAVNQGGKRKGAMCAYLETWHLDLEDFLELRKNTGDERRRTHDMNTANWIPDLFMKRVSENGSWTLFSPSDVPDLHDLYGQAFEKRYQEYEAMVERGEMKLFKKVDALTIWRKILSMLFETGHPWVTFKDPSNIRSPQDHAGVVHSSNLCTEILLNTSKDEVAVCNLGSINLVKHIKADGTLDRDLLAKTVKVAIRMLDNVIDLNFYPIIEAKNSNLRHRPIGLGIMGFQECLYAKRISYASPQAVEFADESMELISYYAILASSELAKERGAYSSFKGSKWDRGLLPVDTVKLLEQERGAKWLEQDTRCRLDWAPVRESIKKFGMRNSNCMAIAPTATISNITGVTQSIEPEYKHLYAKSNLSGEFAIINEYLVRDLKGLGLWDAEMVDDLKYFDGSIMEIERIPEDLKKVYLTSFEVEPEWIIECAARRQKWIDMGQSLNLYIAQPSGKRLNDMYMLAWKKGLKTTYYLRSQGATQVEKSTTDINKRGLQPRWMKNKSASSDVVVVRNDSASNSSIAMPKAAKDEICESCQ